MKFTHDQDGTHYVLWRLRTDEHDTRRFDYIYAVETGWGSNYGQWLLLADNEVHWNYLTEKMPGLRDGDKPGLIVLFAKAGLEVYG